MAENGTLRQRKPVAATQPSLAGKESDARLDKHERYVLVLLVDFLADARASYEFGGPIGVTAMIFGFPVLMYYLWICLWFYDGQLVHPTSVGDISPFIDRMWGHVVKVRIQLLVFASP